MFNLWLNNLKWSSGKSISTHLLKHELPRGELTFSVQQCVHFCFLPRQRMHFWILGRSWLEVAGQLRFLWWTGVSALSPSVSLYSRHYWTKNLLMTPTLNQLVWSFVGLCVYKCTWWKKSYMHFLCHVILLGKELYRQILLLQNTTYH